MPLSIFHPVDALYGHHSPQQYKWHAESRESIELAYDAVLQEAYKRRNKFGFRPPKTGRRTDAQGDPEVR